MIINYFKILKNKFLKVFIELIIMKLITLLKTMNYNNFKLLGEELLLFMVKIFYNMFNNTCYMNVIIFRDCLMNILNMYNNFKIIFMILLEI